MNWFDLALHGWLSHYGWTSEAVFRLVLAGFAGGIVGAEREIRGREAGFRTHILVCMASALVMLVSLQMTRSEWQDAGSNVRVSVDLIRIAYAVMTGIGFLGAGAILQHQGSVRGLTTAAAMWSVAAIGLAAGFGMYSMTVISAGLVVLALWLFNYVGDVLPRRRYRTVVLRCPWQPACVNAAVKECTSKGVDVVEQSYERIGDLTTVEIRLRLVFSRRKSFAALEERLCQEPHFKLIATSNVGS